MFVRTTGNPSCAELSRSKKMSGGNNEYTRVINVWTWKTIVGTIVQVGQIRI